MGRCYTKKLPMVVLVVMLVSGISILEFMGGNSRDIAVLVDGRSFPLEIPEKYIVHVTRYGMPEVGEISLLIDKKNLIETIGIEKMSHINQLKLFIRLRSTTSLYNEMLGSRRKREEYKQTIYRSNDILIMGSEPKINQLSQITQVKSQIIIMTNDLNDLSKVDIYATCWPLLYESTSIGQCEGHVQTKEGINVRVYIPFVNIREIGYYSVLVRNLMRSFLKG